MVLILVVLRNKKKKGKRVSVHISSCIYLIAKKESENKDNMCTSAQSDRSEDLQQRMNVLFG